MDISKGIHKAYSHLTLLKTILYIAETDKGSISKKNIQRFNRSIKSLEQIIDDIEKFVCKNGRQ